MTHKQMASICGFTIRNYGLLQWLLLLRRHCRNFKSHIVIFKLSSISSRFQIFTTVWCNPGHLRTVAEMVVRWLWRTVSTFTPFGHIWSFCWFLEIHLILIQLTPQSSCWLCAYPQTHNQGLSFSDCRSCGRLLSCCCNFCWCGEEVWSAPAQV